MIFAFLSGKIQIKEDNPISFIHVQNVIETFDENLGISSIKLIKIIKIVKIDKNS